MGLKTNIKSINTKIELPKPPWMLMCTTYASYILIKMKITWKQNHVSSPNAIFIMDIYTSATWQPSSKQRISHRVSYWEVINQWTEIYTPTGLVATISTNSLAYIKWLSQSNIHTFKIVSHELFYLSLLLATMWMTHHDTSKPEKTTVGHSLEVSWIYALANISSQQSFT